MDVPITKRLHISGLTPSITADDIAKRLSTFGTVKTVDGIGLLDGVGQPRKFGYVTIETTTGKLARCMNVLSGATWKGAKLRLGEAKPNFAEKVAAERAAEPESRPRKRRRCDGVYSTNMELVTPENVDKRAGWKKTTLGRILRPIRMRPERPLPFTLEELALLKKGLKKRQGTSRASRTKRPKLKAPPTRSRKRTINMIKWGSTQLKGIFLESQGSGAQLNPLSTTQDLSGTESDTSMSDDDNDEEFEEKKKSPVAQRAPSPVPSPLKASPKPQPALPALPVARIVPEANTPVSGIDLSTEKKNTLDLLASIFAEEDDWARRESVGSDIDEEELLKGDRLAPIETNNDFEVVPLGPTDSMPEHVPSRQHHEPEGAELQSLGGSPVPESVPEATSKPTGTDLKDLFAPRNEDAGFSLLGHLDLDLELDEVLPFTIEEPSIPQTSDATATFQPTLTGIAPSASQTHTTTYINPKQPLFFPLPRSSDHMKARQRDIFDIIKDSKWDWRDPSVAFYRTGTEEEIRNDWEEKKSDLTRDWKKRAREAVKTSRKRKGGFDGDGDV